jgi:ABC-type Na+ efflux pump permease subunit
MRLDPRTVFTLYRAELRMALRDRRTLFFSIALPVLVMPLMMFASHLMQQKREGELAAMTHRLAVVGSESETARGWIVFALARTNEKPRSEASAKKHAPRFEIEEIGQTGVEVALARGDLSLYVLAEKNDAANRGDDLYADSESALPGVLRLTIVYRGDWDMS